MSTRLYLCFEQTPQWYKKNKLLFLFDRNACRVIADLEYLIRKKFGINSICNLYLDGYLLPSRENIEIVRDGDNLRVENEAVESNDQEEPSLSKKRKMPTSKSSFGKSGANSFGNTKSSSKRQKNMFSKASVPDLPSTSSSSSSDDDSDDEDSPTDDSSTAKAPSSRKPQNNNTAAMRRLSNHATKFSNKQQPNKNKISPFKHFPSSLSSSSESSLSSETQFSNKPEIKKKKISAVSQIPFTSSSSSSESTSSSESQNAKMPLSSRKQTIKASSTNKSSQSHVYSLRSSSKPKRTAQGKGKTVKSATKVLAGPSSKLNGSLATQSKKKNTLSSTKGNRKNDKKAPVAAKQLAGPSADQSEKKKTSSSTKASTAKSSSTAEQAGNLTQGKGKNVKTALDSTKQLAAPSSELNDPLSNQSKKKNTSSTKPSTAKSSSTTKQAGTLTSESQKDSLNNNVTTQSNSVYENSANSITSTKKPSSSTVKQSMDSSTYPPPSQGRDNQLLSNSFLSRDIPLATRSLNSSHIHFGSDDDDDDDGTPIATQQPQITPNEAEQIHKQNSLSSYQNDDRMLNNQAHSLTEQMTTTQVPIQTSNFNGSITDEHVIQENCKARKEIDYNMLPSLCGPPRSGDRIAYKLLEISASYTPEISEYKEGVVLSYDPTNCKVLVELTPESLVKPVGDGNVSNKFELISGDEEEEDDYFSRPPPVLERKVTVGWSSMISPKLMNP